MLIFLYKRLLA